MKIIDMIKDQQVHFDYYRDGEMWYKTDNGFMFPVPVHDTREIGNATFMRIGLSMDQRFMAMTAFISTQKLQMNLLTG